MGVGDFLMEYFMGFGSRWGLEGERVADVFWLMRKKKSKPWTARGKPWSMITTPSSLRPRIRFARYPHLPSVPALFPLSTPFERAPNPSNLSISIAVVTNPFAPADARNNDPFNPRQLHPLPRHRPHRQRRRFARYLLPRPESSNPAHRR